MLEQRIGRIYRLGQRRPIDVYNLVSEPGIESRIADLVGSKQAFFTDSSTGRPTRSPSSESWSASSRIEQLVPAIDDAIAETSGDDGADGDPGAPEAEGDRGGDGDGDPNGDRGGDAALAASPAAGRPAPGAPTAEALRSMLGQIRVERLADGRLALDAPPDSAAVLADLLRQMAGLLASPPR